MDDTLFVWVGSPAVSGKASKRRSTGSIVNVELPSMVDESIRTDFEMLNMFSHCGDPCTLTIVIVERATEKLLGIAEYLTVLMAYFLRTALDAILGDSREWFLFTPSTDHVTAQTKVFII